MTEPSPTPATAAHVPPPNGMRTFAGVLVNTAVANVTTSYLWFALTFWVYLETRSVLATGIIGVLGLAGAVGFAMYVPRYVPHRR